MSDFPNELGLYFDGSCEPCNPGGVATYGWIAEHGGEVLASGSGIVARGGPGSTNNVAEYSALGFGLRHLADRGWSGRLYIFGDSQLVVKQMGFVWACNKEHLQKLRARCLELLEKVCPGKSYTLTWIPREQNAAADALSRQAYEQGTGKKYPERKRR